MRRNIPRLLLIAILAALLIIIAIYLWLAHDLPPRLPRRPPHAPSMRITDRHGRLLYDVLPAFGEQHIVILSNQHM